MVDYKALGKKDYTPERMRNFKFVKITDILGKECQPLDFELFTSKNSEKYSDDTARGIHLVVKTSDGDTVRVCTHASRIVTAFESIQKDGFPVEDLTPFTIVAEASQKGGLMYNFADE